MIDLVRPALVAWRGLNTANAKSCKAPPPLGGGNKDEEGRFRKAVRGRINQHWHPEKKKKKTAQQQMEQDRLQKAAAREKDKSAMAELERACFAWCKACRELLRA